MLRTILMWFLLGGLAIPGAIVVNTYSAHAEEPALPPRAVEVARPSGFSVTNSMVVTWLVAAGLILFARAATSQLLPALSGLQRGACSAERGIPISAAGSIEPQSLPIHAPLCEKAQDLRSPKVIVRAFDEKLMTKTIQFSSACASAIMTLQLLALACLALIFGLSSLGREPQAQEHYKRSDSSPARPRTAP
jgi:hypothetical protein